MQKVHAGRSSASEIRGGRPGPQNSLEVLTGGSDDGRPRARTDARAVVGLSCQSQKWNCGPLWLCEDLAYVAVFWTPGRPFATAAAVAIACCCEMLAEGDGFITSASEKQSQQETKATEATKAI
jgi:hypothetical protein